MKATMKKRTKRGRPKAEKGIHRETILTEALKMLDRSGPQGFSMRSLASRLKVTPMALYHHFTNRSILLRDLSDWVYAEVVTHFECSSGSTRERIKHLLILYHQTSLRHPHLTLSIFATPEAFSKEAKKITSCLFDLLAESKLSKKRQKMWIDILVDYTHGSSLATAMLGKKKKNLIKDLSSKYVQQLDELLDHVF